MPFELSKSLPKPGTRFALPTLYGSADAYALATAALALKAEKRILVVVVANASDGQRLLTELPWFASTLSCHLLPDWETLPYDAFSRRTRIWCRSAWQPCMKSATANAMY